MDGSFYLSSFVFNSTYALIMGKLNGYDIPVIIPIVVYPIIFVKISNGLFISVFAVRPDNNPIKVDAGRNMGNKSMYMCLYRLIV